MIDRVLGDFQLLLIAVSVLFVVQLFLDLALTLLVVKTTNKHYNYEDVPLPKSLKSKNYIFLVINTAVNYILITLFYALFINAQSILNYFKLSRIEFPEMLTSLLIVLIVGGLLIFMCGEIFKKLWVFFQIFPLMKSKLVSGKLYYKKGSFLIEYRSQYFFFLIIFIVCFFLTRNLAFLGATYFSLGYIISSKKQVAKIQKAAQKAFGSG